MLTLERNLLHNASSAQRTPSMIKRVKRAADLAVLMLPLKKDRPLANVLAASELSHMQTHLADV